MAKSKKATPTFDDVKYLQDALYVIGGKWKLPILLSLGMGYTRFRQIQNNIPGISAKMLAKELHELELNQLIARKTDPGFSSKAEYEVASYCKSMDPLIRQMIQWGREHRQEILGISARGRAAAK